jgi:hypothetical protein
MALVLCRRVDMVEWTGLDGARQDQCARPSSSSDFDLGVPVLLLGCTGRFETDSRVGATMQ